MFSLRRQSELARPCALASAGCYTLASAVTVPVCGSCSSARRIDKEDVEWRIGVACSEAAIVWKLARPPRSEAHDEAPAFERTTSGSASAKIVSSPE